MVASFLHASLTISLIEAIGTCYLQEAESVVTDPEAVNSLNNSQQMIGCSSEYHHVFPFQSKVKSVMLHF